MKGKTTNSLRVRCSDSMKVRVQAYMLKHDCSEADVIRRALRQFLPKNVERAREQLRVKS